MYVSLLLSGGWLGLGKWVKKWGWLVSTKILIASFERAQRAAGAAGPDAAAAAATAAAAAA